MSQATIKDLKKCEFERDRMEATGTVYCTKLDQYVGANFCAFMCQNRKEAS